jgi:hypothetical protein
VEPVTAAINHVRDFVHGQDQMLAPITHHKIVFLVAVLLCPSLRASAAPAAENYLSRLQDTIARGRSNLATFTNSAGRAAAEYLSGGNLWAAGRQADFISEACGRAGGLMAIAPLGGRVPTRHDIILYAVPGAWEQDDLKMLEQWQEKGATVIQFSSPAGVFGHRFPLDTVANVIDLWTWTGEFVAACTRLGQMPVLYQSYGLPGGPARGKKYQGKKFHDDLTVKPIAAGVLGREYLDQIQRMLAKINETQMPKILQAARWWSEVPKASATTLVTGHMFPRHAQDPRTLPMSDFAALPAWENKDLLAAGHPPALVLCLGYQFAPQKLLEQAKALGVKLVYSDVQPAQPPEPASNILYRDTGLLHPVDIHRDNIADDGRFKNVPVAQAIVGATLVRQIGEPPQRSFPADNLYIRRTAVETPGKALIPCGAMGGAGPAQKYLEFLNAG